MCAIIGAIGGKLPSEQQFKKARDAMAHRGPDDAGVYYSAEESVALGHRRLSIIDLSKDGHQPFVSPDGRFVLIYNGEIYNYIELRDELGKQYSFRTETDTEVLLASYIVWGEKCLQKFNGMFAFAIWDTREKKLFCARDRLGIKPFFYLLKNNTFYFASEIKGLLSLGIRCDPNEQVIFDYLYHGFYDHSDDTFFADIRKMPAGNFLVWKSGSAHLNSYWDLAEQSPRHEGLNDKKIRERFKEIIADAIKIRFRSDVPIGINLSSGLDSNSLLYYSKKIFDKDIATFSMRCPDGEYDEGALIEQYLTDAQKEKWHAVVVNPRTMLKDALAVNAIQDQPFGGVPTLMYAHLNNLARAHNATVLLEGQGVDEILAGYDYYRPEYDRDVEGLPIRRTATPRISSQDLTSLVDVSVLEKRLVKKHKTARTFKSPFASHLLNAQYRDIVYTKLPRVLRFNDHVSMAYGIELRLPFLDYRFVEFCFFLPPRYKINPSTQKVLMREAMGGYLPQVVRATQKKSFGRVQGEWLREYHRRAIEELLMSRPFRKRGYWNHPALEKKMASFFSGAGDNSFFLWQCINLELWFREFID